MYERGINEKMCSACLVSLGESAGGLPSDAYLIGFHRKGSGALIKRRRNHPVSPEVSPRKRTVIICRDTRIGNGLYAFWELLKTRSIRVIPARN